MLKIYEPDFERVINEFVILKFLGDLLLDGYIGCRVRCILPARKWKRHD